MVSPELLRRFRFFSPFNEAQLREIAMIAEEIEAASGVQIFDEHQSADALYLLLEGGIELTFKSEEEYHPKTRKIFPVGDINPGEIFGVSALIEPHKYNTAAAATADSRFVKIDAVALRSLVSADNQLGYELMHQVAKVVAERLAYTRVQLAAAWA
jgi:CRP-like cAMP-binding protein